MTRESILGTWVEQKPFRPEEPTSSNWFHFCGDGYLAHEFCAADYEWNRNWFLYEVHPPDRISRICIGSFARQFFATENPRDIVFRRDGDILFINEHPFIQSSERPMPERHDLLSMMKEVEGREPERWSQKYKLIDPKDLEQGCPPCK